MEKVIYGPRGDVARRIVASGGPSQSTVYKDMDSRKTLVSTVTDAEPALRAAHRMRSEGAQQQTWGRCQGFLPTNVYYHLQTEARRESALTGQPASQIWERKKRAYLKENEYLAV